MKERELLKQKKIEFVKSKKEMKHITAVSVIEFIESESSNIKMYRCELQDLLNYKECPPLAIKKKDTDIDDTIMWIQTELTFLKSNVIWLIPCGERGIWWAKTKVIDYKRALHQLWEQSQDICIIDIDNSVIFSISINENNIEIALKELI